MYLIFVSGRCMFSQLIISHILESVNYFPTAQIYPLSRVAVIVKNLNQIGFIEPRTFYESSRC